ncbi:oxidoreductase, short-chain dehydrogenase/reductase family [Aspergillus ibericus CBS 121593]|uniref:Short-chain dehydrogenase/reductase n=1 Tax=Aspergillus ibericus CBS 121593 TaxID=1448316 RepID=A0A395GI87_9EURO|nr:short-chain dehydrogenase/reductase [Aspergillus ibericus CBS 121593]RAK95161.1 short-chain dehydrogenase/reductase [Aspergillus ibericus CBS 121593]
MGFRSDRDIPDLTGKTILVTGGNIGLGKACVLEYARHHPDHIWLAARNLTKAQAAADEIKEQVPDAPIRLLELDLTSFDSIKRAAQEFAGSSQRLDILMLNAGIMASPPGLTQDGYEIQFGTNHMGHALLTKLLLPILEQTAHANGDARVVSLSSDGHSLAPPGGFQFDTIKTSGDSLSALARYGQSKLANILWIRQLAVEYPALTTASIHPGVVSTNLLSGATDAPCIARVSLHAANSMGLLSTVEKGIRNQLWASVSPEVKSGEYYTPVGVSGKGKAIGRDMTLARKLWDWTDDELNRFLSA